jgi:hypothetical protein
VVLKRSVVVEEMCREFQQDLSGCWLEKTSASGGLSQVSYEDLVRMEFEVSKKVNNIRLDPNHSHFILIDEASNTGVDRAFRATFEACISDRGREYPIYQLQNLRNQPPHISALQLIFKRSFSTVLGEYDDMFCLPHEVREDTCVGHDDAKSESMLDCISRDAETTRYNGSRVLKVEMAGARSALQALYMREQGWGVDDLTDMTKNNTKEPTSYWCEGVSTGGVCSALQAIWLHAGRGPQSEREEGRMAFAEAMKIKIVDERIEGLKKALADHIEALQGQVAGLKEEYENEADIEQKRAMTFSRKIIGERLYTLIQASDHKLIKENGILAGKITGMLLESIDLSELATLVDDRAALLEKIEICSGAPHTGTVYGPCGPLAIFGPIGGPEGYLSKEEKRSFLPAPERVLISDSAWMSDSKYAAFLCHDRGKDSQGRDNHARVVRIQKALLQRGVQAWVDDEEMKGDIDTSACKGIDESAMVCLFITKRFMEKVGGLNEAEFCRLEFNYAKVRKTASKMLCVVMEPQCLKQRDWTGPVMMHMGSRLYVDFSSDENFEDKVDDLLKKMRGTTGPVMQANKNIVKRLLKEKKKQLSSRLKLAGYLKTLEDQMADLHQECQTLTTKGSASFNFQRKSALSTAIEEEENLGDVQNKREGLLRKLQAAETAFTEIDSNIELGKVQLSSISDKLDINKDGSISKHEFSALLRDDDFAAQNSEIQADFDFYDRDGDGQISKEEIEEAETQLEGVQNLKGAGHDLRYVLFLNCVYAHARFSKFGAG